ncbi:hypothetical protein [Streptomyces lavendulocolor]|uniref:hypothetical protein n=1 Tax=Streptomyces lavendulocolor TaxID=67316 RepID=UPI003C2ADB2A
MSGPKTGRALDVRVSSRGQVPRGADAYLREKVLAALGHVGEPVSAARVKPTATTATTG